MTHEQSAFWLAGVFDGEGCVATYGASRRVFIANTDETIIQGVTEALDVLGIEYRISQVAPRKPQHKPQWLVNVTGQANLILFYNWVPFRSDVKTQRLYDSLLSYKRPHPDLQFYSPDGTVLHATPFRPLVPEL